MSKIAPVPELRFPKFHDTLGWDEKKFKALYSFLPTNSLSRDKLTYVPGSIKNIHYGDIHTKFSTLFDITKEEVPFISASEVPPNLKPETFCAIGDIVFADASEDLEDVGKSIEIVNLDGEKVLSGLHTILARQNEPALVVGFGGHLFKSPRIRKSIQREAQGAKVLGLSKGRLESIQVCYPRRQEEQQKIADCLTSIDDLITAEAEKIATLRDHKKGLMQHLFPRKGETTPRFRFPEFRDAGDWLTSDLERVASVSSGGTPSRGNPKYWGGDIPWVSTTLIDFNTITTANEFITKVGLEESSAKFFEKSTILMAMYGQGKTRGKVALLGIDATINQACAAITVDKGMNADFVFQNLCSRYDEIRSISNQGGQENLSGAIVKKIPLSYPDPKSSEQQKIAECLTSIDDLITAEVEKLIALKDHKKGLMQQLFPARYEVNE